MKNLGISAVLVLLVFSTAPDEAASQSFSTVLTGAQEVPPVETRARSIALFRFLFNDKLLIGYRLNFFHANEVTDVHIHNGPVGMDGPIVLNLRPDAICIDISPFFTLYFATADHLRGSLMGGTLSDLRALMSTGETYLNLHTPPYPGGEIRGQFRP